MTRSTWMTLILAGTFLLGGVPAMADEATNDLRCYIVSTQMVGTANPEYQMAGLIAHGYWLGKLDSIIPQEELADRLIAESKIMSNPETFKAEATRCGQEMMARGKAESDMGKAITARTREMQQQQDTR